MVMLFKRQDFSQELCMDQRPGAVERLQDHDGKILNLTTKLVLIGEFW